MNFSYHVFRPGNPENAFAGRALEMYLRSEAPEKNYTQMMRFRLNGLAKDFCDDSYFITLDEFGKFASRVWYGFGRHRDSVGNFGNFMTDERFRGQGAGGVILRMLADDLKQRAGGHLPLALFCTAGSDSLTELYGKLYGFRPAFKGKTHGRLYCPLGDSPETFDAFCEKYYNPSGEIEFVPGNSGYRHEIDCLLCFALENTGRKFGLPGAPSFEDAILSPESGKLEVILDSETGHCAGWAFTPTGERTRSIQIHPAYEKKNL